MTRRRGRTPGKGGRLKKLLAISAAAALTSLSLAAPAQAMPGDAGIQPGHNITVFHNLDFVAVFGYEVGEPLTVEVFRGDHLIGSASGPAVDTGATGEGLIGDGGLEVNHGPEGDPLPGDCWQDFTPDILPGDRIVVTSAGGAVTEDILVDNITMEAPKDETSTADPSDVIVQGRAAYADGTPIPVEELDSGEIRVGSDFRAAASEVVRTPGTTDGYTAIYRAPYTDLRDRNNLTPAQEKQAILDGDHAMGYGHVAPLPDESQLVDGLGGGGPAPGCEGSPAQANAVTTSDDEYVNLASGDLNLGGTAMEAVSGVSVTLSDGDDATADPVVESADLSAGPGQKNWSVQFSRAQLDALGDGTLTATGSYALEGGAIGGVTLDLQKDTVAPADATADPAGGVYKDNQSVALSSEPGTQIRYTVSGADPTPNSGQLYNGQRIQVTSDQTIKALVVDAAGNPSGVASFGYTFDRIAPGLSATPDSGSYNETQFVELSSNDAGASIFYTTDGSTPDQNSQPYVAGSPIEVAQTQTIRAIAYDAAGNASPVVTRNITIREATATTLNTSTANLKLGKTRILRGAVSPVHANASVRLTIDRPGSLPTITRTVALNPLSGYTYSYRPTAVGTYRVSASFLQDNDSLGSVSATKSFRVIR